MPKIMVWDTVYQRKVNCSSSGYREELEDKRGVVVFIDKLFNVYLVDFYPLTSSRRGFEFLHRGGLVFPSSPEDGTQNQIFTRFMITRMTIGGKPQLAGVAQR